MAEQEWRHRYFWLFLKVSAFGGFYAAAFVAPCQPQGGAEFSNSAGYRIVVYDPSDRFNPLLLETLYPQGAPLRDVKNLGKMRFNYSLLGGPIYGSDVWFLEECVSPTYSVISVALDNAAPYPPERTPSTSTRRLFHPPAEIFKQSRTFKHLRKSTLFSWLDMLPPGSCYLWLAESSSFPLLSTTIESPSSCRRRR